MADIKIGVDADDATRSIEQLKEVFDRFAAASEKQSATWAGVADETKKAAENVEGLHVTMLGVADAMQQILDRQDKVEQSSSKTARHWQFLSRHTKQFAGHIKEATDSILKWAGVGGLIVGAAGFGAEHAIFDLAGDVSRRRSTALGLNTSYGGLASARVNYGRFGDADAALGNIAAAQNDPSKRLGLSNLGVAFDGRDSSDVLADAMESVKRLLDRRPAGVGLAQYSQNLHLDDVFSTDALQRLQNSSDEEVGAQARRLRGDRKGLDLAPDVQRKWQELTTQLAKAGTAIETVLVNRLVALEPGLQKLSEAFTRAADTLLKKDGPVEQWLEELGKDLDDLAKWLEDPASQKKIDSFLDQVGEAAKFVWGVGRKALELLHWLAQLTGTDAGDPGAAAAGGGQTSLTPGAGTVLPEGGGGGGGVTGLRGAHEGDTGGGYRGRAALGNRGRVDARGITAVDKTISPEGRALLDTLASGEAPGYNVMNGGQTFSDYSHHPGGRAAGRYQDLPSTWRGIQAETGIKDFSPESQDKGNWYLAQRDYKRHTGRDLETDLKDPSRTESIGRALHSTWVSLNGSFVAKYHNYKARVDAAAAPQARPAAPPAKVTVSTNPGGNPHVAAAAAAAPQ